MDILLTADERDKVNEAVKRHGEDLERELQYIPHHCREGCREYILDGRPVGDFLTSVFENDLVHAATGADDTNIQCLVQYARLLYNAPRGCWGSKKIVVDWMQNDGLRGVYAKMLVEKRPAPEGRPVTTFDDERRDANGRPVDEDVTDFKGEVNGAMEERNDLDDD